jgi:hypothetical protein
MASTKNWIEFTTDLEGKVFALEFTTNGPDQNVHVKFTREGVISSIYTLNVEEKQQLIEWLSLMSETP